MRTSLKAPTRIAIILGSSIGAGHVEFEQFFAVYYALQEAGAEVLVASETGGYPWRTHPKRLGEEQDELARRFQADRRARDDLANTIQFDQLFVEDFHGGFCIGEPGTIWRDAEHHSAGTLIARFLKCGKPVAVLRRLLDIAPNGAEDGLLILGDGTRAPSAAVAALLAAATRQFENRRIEP